MALTEAWLLRTLTQTQTRLAEPPRRRPIPVPVERLPGLRLEVPIPGLRLVSEKNRRDHWAVRHRRVRGHRTTVYRALQAYCGVQCPLRLPLQITLTRLAPQLLDPGNYQVALSAVQDGVADYLAGAYLKGQDRQEGLAWAYDQRQGDYGVLIVFEEEPL